MKKNLNLYKNIFFQKLNCCQTSLRLTYDRKECFFSPSVGVILHFGAKKGYLRMSSYLNISRIFGDLKQNKKRLKSIGRVVFTFIVCNNKKKSRKIIISNIVAVISVTSKIHIRLLVVNIYIILYIMYTTGYYTQYKEHW